MKYLLYICLFVLTTSMVDDGGKLSRKDRVKLRKANTYLKLGYPDLAVPLFLELYNTDSSHTEIIFGLGRCYLSVYDQRPESIRLLEKAYKNGEKEASFYLALIYLKMERFDDASEMIEKYSIEGSFAGYEEVEIIRQTIKRAKRAYRETGNSQLTLLGKEVNSKYGDYMPVITEDGSVLFFTSRRHESSAELHLQGDEDIYMAESENGNWRVASMMAPPINSETHDATVALIDGGSNLVFYRTNKQITGGNLMSSLYSEGKWAEPVDFNKSINTDFQESSAWVSSDNRTIFFASNRPGGFGGKDLYRVVMLPDGRWSLPLNLGPTINTPMDEDGPFYHESTKTLYFMSNGHETIGGFDIFYSVRDDENIIWKSVENMGLPVNSTNDDIYFVLDRNGLSGYFSSDRNGGYGYQDIYKVDIPRADAYQVVRSVVTAGEGPVSAKITLIDEESREVIGKFNANPINGNFIMVFEPGKRYQIVVESAGYQSMVEYVEADREVDPDTIREMKFTMEK